MALCGAVVEGPAFCDMTGRRGQSISHKSSLVNNTVRAIAAGPGGALWFGTDGGASRYDGSAWSTYTQDEGLAASNVVDIVMAPGGALWFGSCGHDGAGVSRLDENGLGHVYRGGRHDQ